MPLSETDSQKLLTFSKILNSFGGSNFIRKTPIIFA